MTTGADLLDELRAAMLRYVVCPSPEAADAVVLWVAASHGQPSWEHAPRLVVTGPEKRCGKSRLLDIIEATCHEPLMTVNASVPAVVRSIKASDPPTLLVDEADTIFGPKAKSDNEDLRGLLNAGHQRNRPALRFNVTTNKVDKLATFAMAALAGIRDLPDTIMDRAVVIRMRRRAPGERAAPYRTRRDAAPLHDLRDRLSKWVREHEELLVDAEPVMPVEDRAADTWEPLIAVADLAGRRWPERARTAAAVMTATEMNADVETSLGARLLSDIRAVFADLPHCGFLPSAELVNLLLKTEDAPWREISRDGLTQRMLANRLRPYQVGPRHNDAKTVRGYHLADFADSFARYLASPTVQASGTSGDQPELPDTWGDASPAAKCPEGCPDTCPDTCGDPKCPGTDQGEHPILDAWTDRDGLQGSDAGEDVPCDTCDTAPTRIDRGGRRLCRSCGPHVWRSAPEAVGGRGS